MTYKWPLMKDTITWGDKLSLIKFILTTKQFTNGPKVREFEESWNKWLGSKYSLYVSSGSTANLLLLSAVKEKYGLKDGDKVLVPSCTWVTNVAPVIQCGLKPVFCDVNLSNFSFDPDHLIHIANKHPDIKIIFVTHLLGFSADVEFYKKQFPKAIILEDICESHGCLSPDGTKRGSNTVGSTFSFYFGHHMTTVEGGMVSTNDAELYSLMKAKRSHGMARELPPADFDKAKKKYSEVDPKFLFVTDGYNFRNHEMCAVLGLNQIKRLDDMITKRRENFNLFHQILSKYSEHFYLPSSHNSNSSFAFPIIAKDKKLADRLKVNLERAGIETRPIVSGNLLKQPFLSKYKMEKGGKPYRQIDILHENGVYAGNSHFVGYNELQLLDSVIRETISQ